MPKIIDEFINILSSISSISEKQSKKILIDLLSLKNKDEFFDELNSSFKNITFCEKCNKITSKEEVICNDCKKIKSKTLIIVKNQIEYFNLESIIENNELHSYILNIKNKSDLIKFISFGEEFNKLKKFILEKEEIKEIIFSFSHTSENDILIKWIEDSLGTNYNFFQLAKGLPSGNSVEFIDQDTLKFALKNKEKIN